MGSLQARGVELVEMMQMQRRRLEVLCVQESRWKGDRARKLEEGYKLLHVGEDGKSNGMEIIVSEGISKQVVRLERWDG